MTNPSDPKDRPADLTAKQQDVLRQVAWGVYHFGGLISGGTVRVRDLRLLSARGYVKNDGLVTVCDGDGFALEPERFREGWSLTPRGLAACGDDYYAEKLQARAARSGR